MHCQFCQNWEISQAPPESVFNLELPPRKVIKRARQNRLRSVALEPVVFY
ncbi:MAG: hypothetical protein PVG03_09080 [Desulfarculaceae bacterium]